jgi:hypothetical protein
MRYRVEHRVVALAKIAVSIDGKIEDFFEVEGVRFSPWDTEAGRYSGSHQWLAERTVHADSVVDAAQKSWSVLARVVPRIALVAQAYVEFVSQPFLIVREDCNVGKVRYTTNKGGVGLGFLDDQFAALTELLNEPSVPEEFYFYWNEAVNTTGYTPKILLMLSGVEAWAKRVDRSNWYRIRRMILGDGLSDTLFEQGGSGLRHRLVHGEYFGPGDMGVNYVERIHKAVIAYFNLYVLSGAYLSQDVVNPQRHPSGSKEGGTWMIRRRDRKTLTLREIVRDFDVNGVNGLQEHELDYDPHPNY